MLLASDDERDHADVGFTPSKARLKGHEQINVHELTQRHCRCQRKICFRQFGVYERVAADDHMKRPAAVLKNGQDDDDDGDDGDDDDDDDDVFQEKDAEQISNANVPRSD